MRFDVYCDESHPDLLASAKPLVEYMVIGSLWLPRDFREVFKREIHNLRDRHHVGGEFKWSKVSPAKVEFYTELVKWFVAKGTDLRFRAIAVDYRKVDLIRYHGEDQELGFYKFYYQMLHHWILDCNSYCIFCDYKTNSSPDRLKVLKRCLERTNLSADIIEVQAIRSRESVLIQLVDVLTGLTAATLNNAIRKGGAKEDVKVELEKQLGEKIAPTGKHESKFNVFQINPGGGW
jgi:hypothetical protein